MAYSEYCLYSAQTRHSSYRKMRWQMNYVHKAHLASGYLADVEYQEFRDENGEPDWYIFYTPGPLARDHFKSVHKKDWPAFQQPEIAPQGPPKQAQLDFLIEDRGQEDALRKRAEEYINDMAPDDRTRKEKIIRQGIRVRMPHSEMWTEETWDETIHALLLREVIENELIAASSREGT
jgi:hypothetical protein